MTSDEYLRRISDILGKSGRGMVLLGASRPWAIQWTYRPLDPFTGEWPVSDYSTPEEAFAAAAAESPSTPTVAAGTPTKKALVLATCNAHMIDSRGFRWPQRGPAEAPDWDPEPECGRGLHGLLWGIGDYSFLALADPFAYWLVVEVEAHTVVHLDGEVLCPRGNVVYCGGMAGAHRLIAERRRWAMIPAVSSTADGLPAITTDDESPASTAGTRAPAGTTGHASPASTAGAGAPAITAGDTAPAITVADSAPAITVGGCAPASTTGYRSPAITVEWRAPASTVGNWSPAITAGAGAPAITAGHKSPAVTVGHKSPAIATGKTSVACCLGLDSEASTGTNGSVILTYWDGQRLRHLVGYVGEDGILPDTRYRVAGGRIVPVEK